VALSVAGDRKTAYISQIRPFHRIEDVAEYLRLSPGLSSQLLSIPCGGGQLFCPMAARGGDALVPWCAIGAVVRFGPKVGIAVVEEGTSCTIKVQIGL
jgi:hypothetical protein